MSVLLGLEPFQKFGVGGGGGGWVVKRHFSVPLWSKPWTWDMKLGPTKNLLINQSICISFGVNQT